MPESPVEFEEVCPISFGRHVLSRPISSIPSAEGRGVQRGCSRRVRESVPVVYPAALADSFLYKLDGVNTVSAVDVKQTGDFDRFNCVLA